MIILIKLEIIEEKGPMDDLKKKQKPSPGKKAQRLFILRIYV